MLSFKRKIKRETYRAEATGSPARPAEKTALAGNLGGMRPGGADTAPTGTAALAFMGDAVYSLLVRERLSLQMGGGAGNLHKAAAATVSAAAQAEGAKKLLPVLNEKELAVFMRGRNMHTSRRPKNSTDAQYHMATGLEALFGRLYLSGETERLYILFDIAIS